MTFVALCCLFVSVDDRTMKMVLEAYRLVIQLCGTTGLTSPRDAFLTSLCKSSLPPRYAMSLVTQPRGRKPVDDKGKDASKWVATIHMADFCCWSITAHLTHTPQHFPYIFSRESMVFIYKQCYTHTVYMHALQCPYNVRELVAKKF